MIAEPLSYTRETCRLCDSSRLRVAIPLTPLPVASPNVGRSTLVRETAAADVWQCADCGHLQLATVVDPEFQYRQFQYFTGISLGLREHFACLIGELADRDELGPGRFVVDIGSNDGSLLRLAKDRGARVLGIDPAIDIATAATKAGIPTLAEFFDADLGADIATKHGRANVVISNNTIANIDDLGPLFTGIGAVMAEDGLLVIETQYALDVLTKTLLDVIYHEHVSYFAVKPMRGFLAQRGFELIGAERIAPKGGSIRFVAQRKGGPRPLSPAIAALIAEEEAAGCYDGRLFAEFNTRIAELGRGIRDRLEHARTKTGRALAYGASVGCAALVHYFRLGTLIDATFDDTPLTNILHTGERDIPVLTGRQLGNEMPSDVLVLAWRYANPIARGQQRFLAAGGRFFRALPDLAFVDGSDTTPPGA
ncbi:MAG TPA: methyltransferase domain-containing protein [Bradyrhizobium sp.]